MLSMLCAKLSTINGLNCYLIKAQKKWPSFKEDSFILSVGCNNYYVLLQEFNEYWASIGTDKGQAPGR